MGCGNCGTGKPNGCKNNGGCSTGGCNRMNVHDWLMNLPFSDPESTCKIIEVSFNQGSRKEFYRNNTLQFFEKGEWVTIDGVSGFDVGEVSLTGELVRLQMKKKGAEEFNPEIKKVLRRSSEKDLELFKNTCETRQYTRMGMASILWSLQKFLLFLKAEGINSSTEITSTNVIDFLTSYKEYSSRTIANIISVLRNYFKVLHQESIITTDLSKCLPAVRITRNAFIPSVWKQEDVKRLLESIDRQNPKGKRDYAIVLLVTRLGLRVGDIRLLKISNLNWNRKVISITMQKTRQPLELPLLDDVGWAIIDYLKNGRPYTISNNVFIRHKAPYDGFADHNCLHKMLVRHMSKAGIQMSDQKHGLHSLRSTLALVLLEKGTPLPVISEALGHQNIQTTSIYLKIDMNGLRNCIIDPEEVCHE